MSDFKSPTSDDEQVQVQAQQKVQAIISPSMLSADFGILGAEAQRMVDAGADTLHIDVMDGHFVPNISFGIPAVQGLRKHTKAFMDCHLMVSNPRQWLPVFKKIGVEGFTFHYESVGAEDSLALLKEIKALGMRAGVAIKPKTPVDVLFTSGCAAEADMVLIMTVEPGFGGQSFMSDMMPKVEALRAKFPSLLIQVDGGVTTDTIETVAKAGANVIVSGSGIFGAKVPAEAVTTMRNIVNKYCAK